MPLLQEVTPVSTIREARWLIGRQQALHCPHSRDTAPKTAQARNARLIKPFGPHTIEDAAVNLGVTQISCGYKSIAAF
jgi:hypothetical protein